MKAKLLLILIAAALILPAVTSLFDLEARRFFGSFVITTFENEVQTTISPN